MLEYRVKYLEEKLDKKMKYINALMKMITDLLRKEREEKEVEEKASKKEVSRCSKKGEHQEHGSPIVPWGPRVLQGCLGLVEVVLQDCSKASRSNLIFTFLFFMCN
jgi:hypothetical protein